ncbi:MAG TPA: uroporphyrinogen-III synthase [Acidisarcina sp.]|nr:uroporphyrinogen-III synthase [Acidisarcina sp.]
MLETNFNGLRVLALENRRAKEVAMLIRSAGGVPTVVPVMREIPLDSNEAAFSFAQALLAGQFDVVLFLTGVGARILFAAVESRFSREDFLQALKQTRVAVRGPKPVAVLRELGVTADIVSQEPSTWRELLVALDTAYPTGMSGLRIAIQEYGAVNSQLLEGLAQRGAQVTRVPVYQWALPEDLDEMRATIRALERGEFDVLLFLTGVQALHLLQVADEMGQRQALLESLKRIVIVSVGPSTNEELARQGISPDFQPSHPRMGILVNEAAKVAQSLLERKRSSSNTKD